MSVTYKRIDELVLGDVVVSHGLRVRLDDGPHSPRYDQAAAFPNEAGDRIVWFDGEVLNRDEVPADIVPLSFTRREDGGHRWMIQSRNLVRWAVED